MEKEIENKIRNNFENAFGTFNFYRVKLAMQALDWTWAGSKEIPTIREMQDTVIELFECVFKHFQEDGYSHIHGTGGFYVEINERNQVIIQFVVEEQNSFYYE